MSSKCFFAVCMTAMLAGCANTSQQKTVIPPEITGFYSYTETIIYLYSSFPSTASTSVQAVQLNAGGSGFSCSYSTASPGVDKVPIHHISGNAWDSLSLGAAKVTKNSDGSISWGAHSTYAQGVIENTNCN